MARAHHAAAGVVTPLAGHASPSGEGHRPQPEGQPALVRKVQQRFLAQLSCIN